MENKNLLTLDGCKKELLRWAKGNLVPDVVIFAILSLIFVPLLFLSIHIAENGVILGVIFALMCAFPAVVSICRIVIDVITLRLIKNNGFSIKKDVAERFSKDEIPRKYSEGRRVCDVIYFKEHGRFVATGITFNISFEGDEFYLVVLRGKKDRIVFAYNTKTHYFNEAL